MNSLYYVPDGDNVKTATRDEWAKWFDAAERHIGKTRKGLVEISTVFLGIDHQLSDGPPLIFETMIFGGRHDQYQERYSTLDEARAGHAHAVRLVKLWDWLPYSVKIWLRAWGRVLSTCLRKEHRS